ncbi:MAG: transglutaminase family protein [Synechococcus sp.]
MNVETDSLETYLEASTYIDWRAPNILALANQLAVPATSKQVGIDCLETAKACFEWVRDRVRHSSDYQLNPVTCRASNVLKHMTGYCYAKSHLLAALLRANGIPAGLCYQRLSIDETAATYCLHGLNAVYLQEFGWYRIDPRGNTESVDAQFTPPLERLAFTLKFPGEMDFPAIYSNPLPAIVQTLTQHTTWDAVYGKLPDSLPTTSPTSI